MKQVIRIAAPLILGLSFNFAVPITGAQEPKKEAAPASASPTEAQKTASNVGSDFVIGSGDVLNIFVWKEPEVTRTVPVRPDGKISLPLVNDVQASGLTALELKKVLEERLSKFFSEPNVTVTVETVNSQKVTVMGEVSGAGPKPLAGPTRVMDILATSGFTPFAKTTKIYILREVDGKQQRFNFNYKEYLKGKNSEQNILLRNGDTIVVP
ncbi:MAG: polysaccharide biosynthesis/export family protein [Acidobacteria bacterium]|nr:polysaccharide biosynthesis/export family protein [Acidobacteriota bacterium]MCI0718369.1 polysaccharide biosynthesis/export family protein [Acidobacteriota bacterium]